MSPVNTKGQIIESIVISKNSKGEESDYGGLLPSFQKSTTEEKSKSKPTHKSIKVGDIIRYQKANGSWQLEVVEEIMDTVSLQILQKSNPIVGESESTYIWATAIIIVFLEMYFSSTRNEWILVSEKGRKWIKKKLNQSKNKLDIFVEAGKFLKDHKKK